MNIQILAGSTSLILLALGILLHWLFFVAAGLILFIVFVGIPFWRAKEEMNRNREKEKTRQRIRDMR